MKSFLERLSAQSKSLWVRYLLPFLAITIALLAHGMFSMVVPKGRDFPYALFYLIAVFGVAWKGGYGPGVIVCVLTIAGIPLARTPGHRLESIEPSRLILMLMVTVLVSAIADTQRRSREMLRKANEDLDQRVQIRTQDLAQAVDALQAEVVRRTQTEAALRESEQRVDFALDAAAIGRWDLDLATREVNRSPRHDQLFGYDTLQPNWTYETTLEHVVAEDRPAVAANFEAAIHGEGPYDFEFRVQRADGEMRWMWALGKVLRDSAGIAVSLPGSFRDITKRKLAEEKLQIQLDRLNLLDQTTRAIGERQDLLSIFQVVIRSLEERLPVDFACVCLYDAVSEELTVKCVGVGSEALAMELALTDQAQIDIDQNGLSRCIRGELVYEEDVNQVPFPFPQRLARGGLSSLVIAPLQVESKVFGILVVARRQARSFDSSDCEFLRQLSEHVALAANQTQVYTALEQAYDDLRQSQQAVMQQERLRTLGQMASGIAHDINNAISPVVLYTDMILTKEPNLSTRSREYLETIQRSAADVAHTVARMREFYQQHDTRQDLAAVHLEKLTQHVLDLTRARWSDMAQQRGTTITLQTDFAPDLPVVAGIESEIREALTNLVLNALDAMPDGGTLTVRLRSATKSATQGEVHVEITDTGIGMDEPTRSHCLEPFFTTKGERGTGLGLAMVYGVAQRHGAEVEIESAPGKGSTFRLSFPVPVSTLEGLKQLSIATAMPSRLRILVVDDDPLLIKSLRDGLESDGHLVTTANGGREGIAVFQGAEDKNLPFDAVITDLGMPNVDGRKVAAAVKAARSSAPVILLTGWGQRLIAEGDLPPHVDRVLSKPPKLRDLRAALADLMVMSAAGLPLVLSTGDEYHRVR